MRVNQFSPVIFPISIIFFRFKLSAFSPLLPLFLTFHLSGELCRGNLKKREKKSRLRKESFVVREFIRSICNFKTPRECSREEATLDESVAQMSLKYGKDYAFSGYAAKTTLDDRCHRYAIKIAARLKGARYPPIKLFVSRVIKTN